MRSVRKKSSCCQYNENGLCDINVTWQPRIVDWNAHAWTMTSLYQSLRVVHTIEWVCVLFGHHIQNDCIKQQICIKFCFKLEHSSTKTIWMIQKAAAMGNWWLAAPSWQCTSSCIISPAEFFGETSNLPGDSVPLQPRFDTLWLLAFPRTTVTFEREEMSDCWWDSGKYDLAADGEWGNCVRSQGTYFEGNWGIIVLCTKFLVSCIFFNKCLHFSYHLSGYLLDRPRIFFYHGLLHVRDRGITDCSYFILFLDAFLSDMCDIFLTWTTNLQ